MQVELNEQEADLIRLLRRHDDVHMTIIRSGSWRLEASDPSGRLVDEGRGRSFEDAWDRLAQGRILSAARAR